MLKMYSVVTICYINTIIIPRKTFLKYSRQFSTDISESSWRLCPFISYVKNAEFVPVLCTYITL